MLDQELFDKWNIKKKEVHSKVETLVDPREGEVWWCILGKNVGREQNGSAGDFSRPVLILKKFNQEMMWVIPLTTKQKQVAHYYNFVSPAGEKVAAIISQLKLISCRRLKRRMYDMSKGDINAIKLALIRHL